MQNLIIKKRSAIMITNFKNTEHRVQRIFDRLTVFGNRISASKNAPKEIIRRYYITEKKVFSKTQEIVDCLYIPANFPMSFLKDIYPYHKVVDSLTPTEYDLCDTVELKPEFDYRSEKQQFIVSYLNRIGEFGTITDTGLDLITAETSIGKSYSFIRSWVERGSPRLLACFAKLAHLENFKTELLKFTNLTEDDILVVNGQKNIEKATDKPVTLIIARTYSNIFRDQISLSEPTKPHYSSTYPELNAPPKILIFIKNSKIGEVLIDEVHLELHAHAYLIFLLNIKKVTCLTATASRTKDQETAIFKLIMPPQYLELAKSVRIDVQPIFYDSKFPDRLIQMAYSRHGFMNTLYHDLLFNDKPSYFNFVNTLEKVIRDIKAKGAQTIGLVIPASLPFLSNLEIELKERFKLDGYSIGQFTSAVKKKNEREAALDMDICITTEKSFNGSVNPTNMNYMILHGAIQSPVTVEQISGRLRGLDGNDCIFIDLVDELVAPCKDAWLTRRRCFKKIAKSIAEPARI